MTLAEAKAAFLAANPTYQGDPTPEVLLFAGWTPANPLAGVTVAAPVVSATDLQIKLAALVEEAQANSVPAQIIKGIQQIGAIAIGLLAK